MSSKDYLLQALHALYHVQNEVVTKQASTWLEQWQKSVDAWSVSDAVLHDASAPLEAKLFCAQTLRTKVQQDFEELPAEAVGSLRDSIVSLLLAFARGPAPVRTQLGLALAALAAHLPAERWGEGGCIQWLSHRMASEPEDAAMPCMLELLTLLPQEAGSYRPAVRPERRRQVVVELKAASPIALQILTVCLQHPQGQRQSGTVLGAFAAWLRLTAARDLGGAALAQHPLVAAALEALGSHDSDAFDAGVDAVVELVFATSAGAQPEPGMLPLVARLVPAVLALRPRFAAAAQRAAAEAEGRDYEPGEHDDDADAAKGLARLFVEVGECYAALVAGGTPEAMAIAEALLDVAGFPDGEIADMAADFWHRLARHLMSRFAPEPQQGGAPDPAKFAPLFTKLATLVALRAQLPRDFAQRSGEERKDVLDARAAAGETLEDAASVLGGEAMLQLLTAPLAALAAQQAAGGEMDWRCAEATLFSVRAMHRFAPQPDSPLLRQLFAGLARLPPQPQVQASAAELAGAYAQWLAQAARAGGAGDALLPQVLQMLIAALHRPEAAPPAAAALRRVCDAGGAVLEPHLPVLMALYARLQALDPGAAPAAALPGPPLALSEADAESVAEAVAHTVAALPLEQRRAGTSALLMPILQPLQRLVVLPGADSGGAGGAAVQPAPVEAVLPLVDRLAAVFRYIDEPGAVADALGAAWPLLATAMRLYAASWEATERLCRAVRYALRTAGSAASPLVAGLSQDLPPLFAASRHSAFLFLASQLAKVFGDAPQHDAALGPLLHEMLGAACGALRTLGEVSAAPDLADDAFLLAGRVLSYCPRHLAAPPLLGAVLDAAAAGLLVQHREACTSILTFLAQLLDPRQLVAPRKDLRTGVVQAVEPRTALLVREMLAGVGGALPPSRIPALAGALYSLLMVMGLRAYQPLVDALEAVPAEAATLAEKRPVLEAAAAILNSCNRGEDMSSRELENALEEFSELVCRNPRARDATLHALMPAAQSQLLGT